MLKYFRLSGKGIKKLVLWSFIGLLLLTGSLIAFLQTERGQRMAGSLTASLLEQHLQTPVTIDHVKISYTGRIKAEDLKVFDHAGETLLSVDVLAIDQPRYVMWTGRWTVERIHFFRPSFFGQKHAGDDRYNYEYVADKLFDSRENDVRKPSGSFFIRRVIVSDGALHRIDENHIRHPVPRIDPDDLSVRSINSEISHLALNNGKYSADIRHLSAIESTGFELMGFQGQLTKGPNTITLLNAVAESGNSRMNGRFSVDYEGLLDGESWFDGIRFDLALRHFEVEPEDLLYFVKAADMPGSGMTFSGNVSGPASALRLSDMEIWFGNHSHLKGDYRISGLPEVQYTFWDMDLENAHLSAADAEALHPQFPFLDELKRFGYLDMRGRFTGFVNDFVAYADFNSPFGRASTDINLQVETDDEPVRYSGQVQLEGFDLQTMFPDYEGIGRVSLTSSVNGKGLQLDELTADLNARVSALEWEGYQYTNIDLNGRIDQRLFTGDFFMHDPNVTMDFVGQIDLNEGKPSYDFSASVHNAHLKELQWSDEDLVLSSDFDINLKGADFDELSGEIRVRNGRLIAPDLDYAFDSLRIESDMEGTYKKISLRSDMGTADLEGMYSLYEVPAMAWRVATNYINRDHLPDHLPDYTGSGEGFADFHIRVNDVEFLTRLFLPEFYLSRNTFIEGRIEMEDNRLFATGYSPLIRYGEYKAEDLVLEAHGRGKWLDLLTSTGSVYVKDREQLSQWKASSRSRKEKLEFNTDLISHHHNRSLSLKGWWDFQETSAVLNLEPSQMVVDDTVWNIEALPMVYYADSLIEVPSLTVQNENQEISFTGKAGSGFHYPMNVSLTNVRFSTLAPLLPPFYSNFEGPVTGSAEVSNILEAPRIDGAVDIAPLNMEGRELGKATIISEFDITEMVNRLTISVDGPDNPDMFYLSGDLDLSLPHRVQADLRFEDWPVAHLTPYFDSHVSDLKGRFDGTGELSGELTDLSLDGMVFFRESAMTIDYLNTRYRFEDNVRITDNHIYLDGIALKDYRGREAYVNGVIHHRLFNNISADVRIHARDFHALNTGKGDNSVFYGRGYATGQVNFNGPVNDIDISMQLRTERNTRLTLPSQRGRSYQRHEFIRYSDGFLSTEEYASSFVDLGGINLSMDVEFTPSAIVNVHLDAFGDDVLRGRGYGNLRMEFEESGAFSIFGDYAVDEGDYIFTVMDVIRKRFMVDPGGTVSWDGDPFDADLDMTARYRVRASVDELMPTAGGPEPEFSAGPKIPVYVITHLSGDLFSPDIAFDIEVDEHPTTTDIADLNLHSAIQRIRADEQEMQQQVISLMVFNRFVPMDGAESDGYLASGVGSGIGEIVSSQVSGWLSDLSEDLHMGVNYRGQDAFNQRELEVVGSTRLLDDRLGIRGAYDFENIAAGNLEVNYRLTEEGSYEVKAFRRNNRTYRLEDQGDEIWGFGLSFRRQFDHISELFSRSDHDEEMPDLPEIPEPLRIPDEPEDDPAPDEEADPIP